MEEPRKKKILPILGLVLVAILIVSLASYAYWQITKTQTNKNIVGSACLGISFNGSNDINLANAWPISDEEGAETTPYTFTITNNCNDAINYQMALESLVAGTGESANYLDYKYLKVQLNDNEAILYKDLTDLTPESGIRATKELAHHTLAGKESITYNLRLWIDGDTPLQNEDESYNTERFFYGKVKVIAGPNVLGDIALKLLSDPNEPKATLNNISVGDLVGYQTEQFYVIGIDGNNVKLLSRYLLNVGWNPNPNVPLGLQSAELGFTKPSLTSEPVEYGEKIEEETDNCEWDEDLEEDVCETDWYIDYRYGAVPFSEDIYWGHYDEDCDDICDYDEDTGEEIDCEPADCEDVWQWDYPFSESNTFVYNNSTSISTYVNGYAQTLQTMGLNVTNASLLSLEDVSSLCNKNLTIWSVLSVSSNACPNYLYETSYWIGDVAETGVGFIDVDGAMNAEGYDSDTYLGVRPVITVTLS